MNKNALLTLIFFILLLGIGATYGHGIDVTADTMIIANETNGALAKQIADDNQINISVYKFTSDNEVEHQLEHMITNTNKKILIIAYQDTGHGFLENHPELSDRLIIVDFPNNDTMKEGIIKLNNINTKSEYQPNNFLIPLISGMIIGIIIGMTLGILIMKNKK